MKIFEFADLKSRFWFHKVARKIFRLTLYNLFVLLEFTSIFDKTLHLRLVLALLFQIFNLRAYIESFDDTPNNGVNSIKMRCWCVEDEEGGTIGIWASVCHRDNTLVTMRNPYTFVCELWSIGAQWKTWFVLWHDFTALHHKSFNDSCEFPSSIVHVHSFLSCTESPKILTCFRQQFLEEFDYNSCLSFPLNYNIHPNLLVIHAEGWHSLIHAFLLE